MVLSMITSPEGRTEVNRPSPPSPHFIVPQILPFSGAGWLGGGAPDVFLPDDNK